MVLDKTPWPEAACTGFWVYLRFMDSYKWSYKSPNIGYNYSYPAYYNPTMTTHEPPGIVRLPKT